MDQKRNANDFDAAQDAINTTFQHLHVFDNRLLRGRNPNKDGHIFAIKIVWRCWSILGAVSLIEAYPVDVSSSS